MWVQIGWFSGSCQAWWSMEAICELKQCNLWMVLINVCQGAGLSSPATKRKVFPRDIWKPSLVLNQSNHPYSWAKEKAFLIKWCFVLFGCLKRYRNRTLWKLLHQKSHFIFYRCDFPLLILLVSAYIKVHS